MNARDRRRLRRSYMHKNVLVRPAESAEDGRLTWTPSFDHARRLRARDRAYVFERKGGSKTSRKGQRLRARRDELLDVPRLADGRPDCACCLDVNAGRRPRPADATTNTPGSLPGYVETHQERITGPWPSLDRR